MVFLWMKIFTEEKGLVSDILLQVQMPLQKMEKLVNADGSGNRVGCFLLWS